jgi:hypothetical protein
MGWALPLDLADGLSPGWVFLFRWSEPNTAGPGKLREMGLGSATTVSLARAREVAAHAARSSLQDRTRLPSAVVSPGVV